MIRVRIVFKMHFKIALIMLCLLVNPTNSYAQEGTVWGPAVGYEIAYVHSVIINLDGTDILNEEKLPVSDFRVEGISSVGYSYLYEGYGDRGFNGNVEFKQLIPNEPFTYLPSGSFPLLIPLVFSSIDDWPTAFANSIGNINDSNISTSTFDVSPFLSFAPVLSDDVISFQVEGIIDENNVSRIMNNPESLPALTHPRLTGQFSPGEFETILEYSLNTGVLFKFELLYNSREYKIPNSLAIHHLVIYQKIEFVVLIPPGIILENIIDLEFSLLVFFVFILLIFRKQRF